MYRPRDGGLCAWLGGLFLGCGIGSRIEVSTQDTISTHIETIDLYGYFHFVFITLCFYESAFVKIGK